MYSNVSHKSCTTQLIKKHTTLLILFLNCREFMRLLLQKVLNLTICYDYIVNKDVLTSMSFFSNEK